MKDFIVFIAGVMDVNPESLNMNTEYESITERDSLMHLRIVAEIEEKYMVDIPIDEVTEIRTLQDFYNYLK